MVCLVYLVIWLNENNQMNQINQPVLTLHGYRECHWGLAARRIHDHCHTHKAQCASHDVEPIWSHAIHRPSPEKRQHNEHAAIRGIEPTKVSRLKCRYDALENENGGSGNPVTKWPSFAKPEPHKVPASNLAQSCHHEQSY